MGNKSYFLGMYEKSMPNSLSLEEKLFFVKEAGFDHLEISIDESDEKLSRLDYSQAQIDEIKQAMIKSGVSIRTMCLSGHRKYPLGSLDDSVVARSLDIMEKALKFANQLGIRIIQLAGYDVYYEKGNELTQQRFVENLKRCVEMASQYSIVLGFETMETPFMDTVAKAMKYVDLIQSPYLQIFPDIGNLTNASKIYGVSVNDDLMTGQGHLVACHLKETIPGHYREIPFGTGHTQYVENLRLLKQLGVHLFTGEFWYVGQPDWQDVCKNASKFLREKIEQVYE